MNNINKIVFILLFISCLLIVSVSWIIFLLYGSWTINLEHIQDVAFIFYKMWVGFIIAYLVLRYIFNIQMSKYIFGISYGIAWSVLYLGYIKYAIGDVRYGLPFSYFIDGGDIISRINYLFYMIDLIIGFIIGITGSLALYKLIKFYLVLKPENNKTRPTRRCTGDQCY